MMKQPNRPKTDNLGWLQALHPEDAEIVAWKLKAACDAVLPFRLDFRLRRRDGPQERTCRGGESFL